jgi:ubiquinone/menaquinone biosynthesis C-methylase UbiE
MELISRVVRSKEEAKTSYDKMSRWYDLLVGRSEKKFRDNGLDLLNVRDGENVLEIGFGTGHCTLALARSAGPSGKVYGIDISEGMLDITASRIEDAELSGRVELQLGDAANLPFPDDFFDAVFMSFTLELFDTPEIPVVLQQCQRVLKPGGRICVVSMSKEGKSGLMLRLYEWGHKKLPGYIDCRPIFVKTFLEKADFHIQKACIIRLWGLPVEIVLADKP